LRAGRATAALLLAGIVAAAGTGVSAHRYDEYLQASRLAITPAVIRLELSLTPGIAVADAVLRDIDANRDSVLAEDERRAYLERVLRGLSLHVDGARVPLTGVESRFPAGGTLRGGAAAITMTMEARLPPSTVGAHRLVFRNANASHGAVYLANALLPDDDRVAITGMTHAVDQSGLTVVYTIGPASSWSKSWFGWLGRRT
jgi:hypothetical protein